MIFVLILVMMDWKKDNVKLLLIGQVSSLFLIMVIHKLCYWRACNAKSNIEHPVNGYKRFVSFYSLFEELYKKESFQLLSDICSKLNYKRDCAIMIRTLSLEKLIFLFKNYNLDLRNYQADSVEEKLRFSNQMNRFLEKQTNIQSFKHRLPEYVFEQVNQKVSEEVFSKERVIEMLSPLKLKDIPATLFHNNSIDLNYLTYLMLIPNRKSLTIDGLRKIIYTY